MGLEHVHKNSVYADWFDNNLRTVSRGDPFCSISCNRKHITGITGNIDARPYR